MESVTTDSSRFENCGGCGGVGGVVVVDTRLVLSEAVVNPLPDSSVCFGLTKLTVVMFVIRSNNPNDCGNGSEP